VIGVVWKYVIPALDWPDVTMPDGATLLHLGNQGDLITLWALVDTRRPLVTRRFRLAGTGHALSLPPEAVYVGTAEVLAGKLVFHLFDLGEET
jgi:hypothetical protein